MKSKLKTDLHGKALRQSQAKKKRLDAARTQRRVRDLLRRISSREV